MTECLMRYALIGQPASASCKAVKLLQVAVFAPVNAVATVPLYNLRVYFVDDTADAFEVAKPICYIAMTQGWRYGGVCRTRPPPCKITPFPPHPRNGVQNNFVTIKMPTYVRDRLQ